MFIFSSSFFVILKLMYMIYLKTGILILALLFLPQKVFGWNHGSPVTPYGDFCPRCSHYGICDTPLSHEDAEKAMVDYYKKKGLHVEIENARGRFIKAKVKDEKDTVDVIIFDRHTGRIRSIY